MKDRLNMHNLLLASLARTNWTYQVVPMQKNGVLRLLVIDDTGMKFHATSMPYRRGEQASMLHLFAFINAAGRDPNADLKTQLAREIYKIAEYEIDADGDLNITHDVPVSEAGTAEELELRIRMFRDELAQLTRDPGGIFPCRWDRIQR